MVKWLVISDSHSDKNKIDALFAREKDFDAVIHLGDVPKDAVYISGLTKAPIFAVCGNCGEKLDFESEQIISVEGKRILLTHGHKYGVRQSLMRLSYKAEELEVDAVFFGHTHRSFYSESYPAMLNPGALKNGEYGLVEVYEDKMVCELKTLQKTP